MSKRIVVVDDEAHIRQVVSMKLTNAGFEVLTAVDGEEALELCLAENPDLVITDFQMPCLTGMELCRKLRENDSTRQVPILLLSARGFDIAPDEMQAAGIAEVVSKPFSPREILRKVEQLIGEAAPAAAP